jgi:hypothetical protein
VAADHIERRKLASLIPYARNARKHGPRQIAEIAESMRQFGWTMPLRELVHIAGGRGDALRQRRHPIPILVGEVRRPAS